MGDGERSDHTTPSSRRQPETLTYCLRVESVKAGGRTRRELEIASDLYLDELHEVLQAAFGWKDKRRYRFGTSPNYGLPGTEHYLCWLEVAEQEPGVPDDRVRLDEVVRQTGDQLFHRYGRVDQWQRVIRLEAVREYGDASRRAECVGGPRGLDIEAVNLELSAFGQGRIAESVFTNDELPDTLAQALEALSGGTRRRLLNLMGQAMIGQNIRVGRDVATDAVRPYSCLLNLIGSDGVLMLGAETLPPDLSATILRQLDLQTYWYADDSEPRAVTELRHTASNLGLTHQRGDRLVLSELGFQMLPDPVALWWHIAEWLPTSAPSALSERDAALLYVLASATDTDDAAQTAAPFFDALGHYPNGPRPSTADDVTYWIPNLTRVLRCLRMAPDPFSRPNTRHPATQLFARSVLHRWPRG
ncbi:hypothetical protein [Nocardia sp. NPDC052566]|uniref:IS1096 element passenger TnpR family protein n=1 Tax=Nocardia sp. NPDC052566 TaxID=3364330 RepID=UPI0037CBAE82